jgi:hypothetical protein
MPVNKVKEQFELKERVRSEIQLLREAKRQSNLVALSTEVYQGHEKLSSTIW